MIILGCLIQSLEVLMEKDWAMVIAPFLASTTFGVQSLVQTIVTEKYPNDRNKMNGAFRVCFGIGALLQALLI